LEVRSIKYHIRWHYPLTCWNQPWLQVLFVGSPECSPRLLCLLLFCSNFLCLEHQRRRLSADVMVGTHNQKRWFHRQTRWFHGISYGYNGHIKEIYPAVSSNVVGDGNPEINEGFNGDSSTNGGFSIATFDYQRVIRVLWTIWTFMANMSQIQYHLVDSSGINANQLYPLVN